MSILSFSDFSGGQICTKCKIEKPLSEYSKDRTKSNGLKYWCKMCAKENFTNWYGRNREIAIERTITWRANNKWKIQEYETLNKEKRKEQHRIRELINKERRINNRLIRKYNITLGEFRTMLESQENKCLTCFREFTCENRNNVPHIDHDHSTNKVRGLLCRNCNLILGHARDNVYTLQNLIKYLENNQEDK